MPSLAVPIPLNRSLLFHEQVNFHMENNPMLPMFIYANDQAPDGHTTEISFLEFGRAAHRIAHILRPERTGYEGQVVMLIANCDTLLFHAVVAGIFVSGLVPFLVSPRNSAAAIISMMKRTNCSRIATLHHAHDGLIQSIRDAMPGLELVVDELPTLSYAFPKLGSEVEAVPFVPYPGPAFPPDLDSTAIYFHSSGSTGFPKPISHNHRFQASWPVQPLLQSFKANLPVSTRIGVMGLPPFHGYGTMVQLYLPLICLVSAVLYAPRAVTDPRAAPVIPTSDNMLNYARRTRCKILMTVPTFLEQWALFQEDIEELKKLEWVGYGGGPLSEKIGDVLYAAGVAINPFYAGTEFGCPVQFRPDILKEGDWNWMRFSEDVHIRWVPYGDDAYECQVLSSESYPMAVENLPDVKGYATSDLWVKHPTKDLWKIVGRADDVIILASGEKTVPAPMEGIINSSPFVSGAVMFGRQRNQVGVLVEPHPDHAVNVEGINAIAEYRNKIWPVVDEANKTAPAFSRIFKEMILISSPKKPVLRTPKGSIQTKATIKAYDAEIDALYNIAATPLQANSAPTSWTTADLESWLIQLANAISGEHSINASVDLFAQGFDSLSVTYMRNHLINALQTTSHPRAHNAISRVSSNVIFENPTIRLLAAHIVSLFEGTVSQNIDPKHSRIVAINSMIEKYSVRLPEPLASTDGTLPIGVCPSRSIVLLTGSTGGLGSFILSQLLENPEVEKVYALNRPSSASGVERQKSAFVGKGLSIELLKSDRLVYVDADASQDKCGLSAALYDEIRGTITTIIHNAWRLDFNLSLASFEPNIKATRNLVDLALESQYKDSLRFVFTSSVGTAHSWGPEMGAFPEEIQTDPSWSVGPGYGESKYVCDRILAKSGLRATSLRIGQIAGGPNGSWATTDWVPIIVKSSIALGAFPNSHGVISWMRAEDVAASTLDVAFASDAPQVLNIVNPQRPTWTTIMSSIRDAVLERKLGSYSSDDLPLIPFVDWVVRLEERAATATPEDLAKIPAIKLLEYFRGMAKYEELTRDNVQAGEAGMADFRNEKAQRVSKTVARMRPLGDVEARSWINHWSSVGFF